MNGRRSTYIYPTTGWPRSATRLIIAGNAAAACWIGWLLVLEMLLRTGATR